MKHSSPVFNKINYWKLQDKSIWW